MRQNSIFGIIVVCIFCISACSSEKVDIQAITRADERNFYVDVKGAPEGTFITVESGGSSYSSSTYKDGTHTIAIALASYKGPAQVKLRVTAYVPKLMGETRVVKELEAVIPIQQEMKIASCTNGKGTATVNVQGDFGTLHRCKIEQDLTLPVTVQGPAATKVSIGSSTALIGGTGTTMLNISLAPYVGGMRIEETAVPLRTDKKSSAKPWQYPKRGQPLKIELPVTFAYKDMKKSGIMTLKVLPQIQWQLAQMYVRRMVKGASLKGTGTKSLLYYSQLDNFLMYHGPAETLAEVGLFALSSEAERTQKGRCGPYLGGGPKFLKKVQLAVKVEVVDRSGKKKAQKVFRPGNLSCPNKTFTNRNTKELIQRAPGYEIGKWLSMQ